MKYKFLVILSLAAVLFLGGCGKKDDANANNANKTTVNSSTPLPKTSETAATDPNLKSKIEDALKKKGFKDVTVDVTTTPATLRGSYPKDKIAEVMATAMEANGGKPVQNQATGK
jgi:major membrane immunogen (membrane-anchored lipoprotein)